MNEELLPMSHTTMDKYSTAVLQTEPSVHINLK